MYLCIMRTIERTCKNCSQSFLAEAREVNRGNAHYCSLSCLASYKNENKSFNSNNVKAYICKKCGRDFESSSITFAKYCSSSCKQKDYRLNKKSGNPFDRALEKTIKEYPCEICSWAEASRDAHHILSVSKGGKSLVDNLISLCPNHHRLADYNLLSQDYLLSIVKSRTISSSLGQLLKLIVSKEQDANLVIKRNIPLQ